MAISTYSLAKSPNPNYWAYVKIPDAGLEVVVDIPEKIVLAVQSSWEARSFISGAVESLREQAATFAGYNAIAQEETRQIWSGTSPLEFSFTFLFDAQTSGYNDVWVPACKLASMVLPTSKDASIIGTVLLSPGPTRINRTFNAVTLQIGKMLTITDGILTSAQPQFDTRLTADGYPQSAEVEVTIRSAVTYSRDQFLQFATGSKTGGQGSNGRSSVPSTIRDTAVG